MYKIFTLYIFYYKIKIYAILFVKKITQIFNNFLFYNCYIFHNNGFHRLVRHICLFSGYYAIPAGLLVFAASFWASVYMKRHTVREFLLGALCAGLAGLITYFIVHPVF